jgi:hypothetical protein
MTAPDKNSLQSLSISSALNNILAFFNSQDNNSSWKSLTTSSEGSFLIRLLAIVTSNISYKVVSYVREIFLSTCNLISSAIGISVNLGYSVYRGSNQQRLITILPNKDLVIPKYTVIGTYNSDYDIITTEDYKLTNNEPIDINTVIGKLKTVQQTLGTSNLKIFSFYTNNISEDLVLFKDSSEVPYSRNARDMVDDKYWIRTNPFNSIDIQYLNNNGNAKYTYSSGTVLSVTYIELANVPTIPYTNEMFTDFTITNTRIIRQFIPMESVDNIKTTAPYYHETQNLIRSKKDYPKRLPEIDTAITTSDYKVIVPTYAAVSYIKNDYSLLTNAQLNNIYTTLSNERFLASPLPDITHPERELITLDISFKFTSKFVNLSDVRVDIQNLLNSNYYRILNNTFSTFDLEELFTKSLSYVKYARVNIVVNDRTDSSRYNIGDVVEVGNIYYKATDILGTSSNAEPSWIMPAITAPTSLVKEIDTSLVKGEGTYDVVIDDTNSITIDNNIIWKAYKRLSLDNTQISKWAPNTSYKVGDYIYTTAYPYFMFKVVDLIKYNDPALSAPPSSFSLVGEVGTFIEDGDIIWVSKLLNTSNPVRTGNTAYKVGDSVQVGNFSYECIGYRGESNSTLPNFELTTYDIVSQGTDYFEIAGDYTKFFITDDILKVFVSNSLFFSFSVQDVSFINSQNKTRIQTKQPLDLNTTYIRIVKRNVGTSDGNIFWEIIDDITTYSSSWKKYNTIRYNLNTL